MDKDEKERIKLNRKCLKKTFQSEIKEKKYQEFTTLYMSIGMCFGVSMGMLYGLILFSDNMALGMCFGLPIGLCLGMAIGQAKDKRLVENMMEISRIEHPEGFTDVLVYATDKNGVEKEYRVSEKMMKAEKFTTGDKVAEEREGVLVSLESK